jgi:hypothetical protein
LRGAQPDPAAEVDVQPSNGRVQGAVCLNDGCGSQGCFPEARKSLSTLAKLAFQTDFNQTETRITKKSAAMQRISTSS